MVIKIENKQLESLYSGTELKSKPLYNLEVTKKFVKAVKMMAAADSIAEIKTFRGLNFEALKGDLKGKYSVRVDLKYRIILRVEKDEVFIEDVLVIEDLTNHYK